MLNGTVWFGEFSTFVSSVITACANCTCNLVISNRRVSVSKSTLNKLLRLFLPQNNNLQLEGNDKIFAWYERKTVKHKTIS